MLERFSLLVIDSGGRTRVVQPLAQIVEASVVDLTAGLRSPGVQRRSGSSYRPVPRAWHVPAFGWGCTLWALAELNPGADAATPTAGVITAAAITTAKARRFGVPVSVIRTKVAIRTLASPQSG